MSTLVPEVWDEIAKQYEAGVALAVIAKTFTVSRATIKQKADQLGWVRSRRRKGNAGQQARASGSSQGARTTAAISAADRRRLLIEQQRAAWDDLCSMREDAHRLLRGEEPRIIKDLATDDVTERLSRAAMLLSMADKDANSLIRAQEGQRRAYGFDYKQQEAETKEEAEARERRIQMAKEFVERVRMWARSKGTVGDAAGGNGGGS
jgi:hypothetical protein